MSEPGINPPTTEALRELVAAAFEVRRAVLRRTGLTEAELRAIEHLSDTPSSPGDLARLLHLTTGAATGVVDRLEGRGHVERRPHPSDRRRMEVHLTANGHAEVDHQLAPMLDPLTRLDASLGEDERAVVLKFLHDAVEAFHELVDADG